MKLTKNQKMAAEKIEAGKLYAPDVYKRQIMICALVIVFVGSVAMAGGCLLYTSRCV